MNRQQLLLRINRCPEVQSARSSPSHPCAKIVGLQPSSVFQAPEPWRGHIETAPILFVSSNPSISGAKTFPPNGWTDRQIVEYYQGCFDRDVSGPYQINDKAYASVAFWREVRARAGEILGRPAVQGTDFALTELVHCKSTQEEGVRQALPLCTQRWLAQVVEQSGAKVLVVLGKPAEAVCSETWSLNSRRKLHLTVPTPGKDRAILFLPHPNSRGKRKLEYHVTEQEILRLRLLINP